MLAEVITTSKASSDLFATVFGEDLLPPFVDAGKGRCLSSNGSCVTPRSKVDIVKERQHPHPTPQKDL